MHAADAIHGDLGMIQPKDVVLCISKSGDTAEIKVLVPMLKHLGGTLIGMVSNTQSYLATQANYILHTPVSKEADPNNLAPTASTIAQMAIGDAMAMALLSLRGFTPDDFALFHPGGSLGKQLYLRVNDLYVKHGRPSVPINATIRETIIEMTSYRLGCTLVVDDEMHIKGIITDGDLRRMLQQETNVQHLRAHNIMTSAPKTISKDALAVQALEEMKQHSITQLVVVDQDRYVGIIHLHDLIKEGIV
jgi:arabinose-5-phosphate isomerase